MKKILGILICMLLIATAISSVESLKIDTKDSILSGINAQPCSLENWTQQAKLLANSTYGLANFGRSVSIDGDTALIGAPGDWSYGTNSGSAFVFIRTGTTWTQQAKLFAPDAASQDFFGWSVSLDGDTAIIGSIHDDDNGIESGSAYVFTRSGSTWSLQQKLVPSGSPFAYIFGYSVSLDGNTAFIGAIQYNYYIGGVYVFTRTGTSWEEQQILIPPDGGQYDGFGHCVSLEGNKAIIGDECHDYSGVNSGSAYVFTPNDGIWTLQEEINPSDGAEQDCFSSSVSLSGNTALIGARGDDDNGYDAGSTYVFIWTGTTWAQQAKILVSDITYNFGYSVSLDGDTAIIGTYSDSAYVFTRSSTSWTLQQELIPSDGGYNGFGFSVSLDGDTALVGAPGYAYNLGTTYVFIKENHPPDPPAITGPVKEKVGIPIKYNFTTKDPDNDDVYYFIEWGDNTNSGWIGPYSSEDKITESHTWTKKGDYTIKAKAKDIYGNESDWGQLSVTMPLSYEPPQFRFFEWLFERFPHAFLILRHLLDY